MGFLGSAKSGEESNDVATELIMAAFNLTVSRTGAVGTAWTEESSSGGRNSGPFNGDAAGRVEEKSYSGSALEWRGIVFTLPPSLGSGSFGMGVCLDS